MQSLSKIYFFIIFIVLFILIGSIVFFKNETNSDNLQEIRKFVVEDFEKALAFEKANLLTFALALSEDGALKKALMDNDRELAYQILDSIAMRFGENTTIKQLKLQVLTNDFKEFAQNWKDTSLEEMSISEFRKDLEKVKENHKPKVGLETGRRLTFKATIPIRYGEKYIGYLEVIKYIDEFSERLRQKGVEIFALMDRKHILKDNSLMNDLPHLGKYVIANENHSVPFLTIVKSLSWEKLEEESFLKHKDMLFIVKSMLNGERKEIGLYLIVLSKNVFKQYQQLHQNISFLSRFSDAEIHNYIKRLSNPSGAYQNVDDRVIFELLPKLRGCERDRLKEIAKERLEDYDREALINIILDKAHKEKKVGKII